jgi:hypothetical protein
MAAARPVAAPKASSPDEAAPTEQESANSVQALLEEVRRERPPGPAQKPVLTMTRYEQVSTLLIVLAVGIGLAMLGLTVQYIATRPRPVVANVAPLEILEEDPGGSPDGSPDETLKVDSPYEERNDASLVDNPTDELSQIEAAAGDAMDFSDNVSDQAAGAVAVAAPTPQQFLFDAQSSGRRGSATGTGRRGLGMGPGKKGFPRDQRWFISFNDRLPVPEYAKQLDFFRIELGAILPDKIVYLSNMSTQPKTRASTSGKDEKRLYMNWQGGTRRLADIELFETAGIDAQNALILHFYPPDIENGLAHLERNYAERKADEIRRTFFIVKRKEKDGGYEFEVTRQTYLK